MNLVFIIALTFSVYIATTAFGIAKKNPWWRNMLYVCVLAVGQGLMYWLGSLLGGRFMHLFENYSKIIVLIFCFMIAFRMVMDTLKIKSGKNLFLIDKPKELIFLTIALGINPFIAGLIADAAFLPLYGNVTPLMIAGVAFVWGFIGCCTKFSPAKLLINSLLNIVAALAILATGIIVLL